MKTFNATQLSQKPADVFAAAREGGAIIQQKRTNGEVVEEFILVGKSSCSPISISGVDETLYVIPGVI